MTDLPKTNTLRQCLEALTSDDLSLLDFLGDGTPEEKIVGLAINGPPAGVSARLSGLFHDTLERLAEVRTDDLKIVTIGGGTGLSNIVGGDSRGDDWCDNPFTGLKEVFPGITSIVCVTDDGGSTGELLKHLPLVSLGDLRHVFVSSIRHEKLQALYQLNIEETKKLAGTLHRIFNFRFHAHEITPEQLLVDSGISNGLPDELYQYFRILVERLFDDKRLRKTLLQPQCLGNLLIASAIIGRIDSNSLEDLLKQQEQLHLATMMGLREISGHVGVHENGVLPCTTTPAQLQMYYVNGVLVTGEYKSGHARRGYPVDRAIVEFFHKPYLPPEVEQVIRDAHIIIYAPGSLYTSIIPVLQVPGISELIRQNRSALKILVSNIWVQKGETDATKDAPERKFHVSDLVRAYNRNIPGGVEKLFSHILTLGLGEIPGSILQNYALEDKEPIYLDRKRVREIGFEPVEAKIYSADKLHRRNVIQHDPSALAKAVRTLWSLHNEKCMTNKEAASPLSLKPHYVSIVRSGLLHPCQRYEAIERWLDQLSVRFANGNNGPRNELDKGKCSRILQQVSGILWQHTDILPEHLGYVCGIEFVEVESWLRSQQWDNILSFYDPDEQYIIIRQDQLADPDRFSMALLVALGQSLLGNYAQQKSMDDISDQGESVGRVYRLVIRDNNEYQGYLDALELDHYLKLARMQKSQNNPYLYSRIVNSDEGFTPPGLLFGLLYTWYLDNRFAGNIEYKMSIMRNVVSDLIPEQVKIVHRRARLIDFFREKVFRHNVITV